MQRSARGHDKSTDRPAGGGEDGRAARRPARQRAQEGGIRHPTRDRSSALGAVRNAGAQPHGQIMRRGDRRIGRSRAAGS